MCNPVVRSQYTLLSNIALVKTACVRLNLLPSPYDPGICYRCEIQQAMPSRLHFADLVRCCDCASDTPSRNDCATSTGSATRSVTQPRKVPCFRSCSSIRSAHDSHSLPYRDCGSGSVRSPCDCFGRSCDFLIWTYRCRARSCPPSRPGDGSFVGRSRRCLRARRVL